MFDSIRALKAALAQQDEPRNQCGETCERAKLCAVCARGLAEPVQEPEGYFSVNDYGRWEENESGHGTPLYTARPSAGR